MFRAFCARRGRESPRLVFFLVLAALASWAASSGADGGLAWPIPESDIITSSFGEFRGLRLHAGLDFSTHERTGLRVLAVEDGSISRLKVERRGYGNAVYVEHAGGWTSVYAHLDRFEEGSLGLASRVMDILRAKGERYPGDVYLDLPLAVRKGQVIGYSGATGEGPPHLHLEFRRGSDRPFHPADAGFPLPHDSKPPRVEAVVFLPRSADARMNGSPLGGRVSLSRGRVPEVELWGEWEMALLAFDPCGKGSRCGAAAWSAALDGEALFAARVREFSYAVNRAGGRLHHPALSGRKNGGYAYRLTRQPEETPGVSLARALKIDAEGERTLFFRVEDSHGNTAARSIRILARRPGAKAPDKRMPDGRIGASASSSAYPSSVYPTSVLHPFRAFVAVEAESEAPILHLEKGGAVLAETAWEDADGRYFAVLPISPAMTSGRLVMRGNGGEILHETPLSFAWTGAEVSSVEHAPFLLEVPAGAAWEEGAVWLLPVEERVEEDELRLVASADVAPAGEPYAKPLRLSVPAPLERATRHGWYRKDFSGERWSYLGSEEENGRAAVGVPFGARYAFMEDVAPPVLHPRLPRPGGSVPRGAKEWSATARDGGSGVDYRSVRFILDGTAYAGDYDPDTQKIFLDLDWERLSPEPGAHTLRIETADLAGNAVAEEFSFEVER